MMCYRVRADPTGNSRFWTIPAIAIDHIDMQQVFAQLKGQYEAGAERWLNSKEEAELARQNRKHRNVSVIGEKITAALDLTLIGKTGLSRDSATDVLRKLGIERPSNPQSKEANAMLRELRGDRPLP